ncbi:hypothetical protein [Kangiella sp. TOML190]|uniref:hypothetical protein n=1 Tax=Kangiella sp. TOML190 TaxID=2931351 RepID=UPI00203C8122|nr:hypothetical protein [Kangiella sp. TOML190]
MESIVKKGLLCVATAALINGCSYQKSSSRFSEKLEFPKATKTALTDHIGCFGDMLSEYRFASGNGKIDPLRIAVVSVRDKTAISTVQYPNSEIPNDFTEMALSVAAKIGGPVRLVHIPKEEEVVISYQYGATPGKKTPFFNNYAASHYRADTIQIYGALTEYDRFIKNKRRTRDASFEVGGGSGETELEYNNSSDKNTARMTMDFYTAHGFVGDIVNHSSATNTIDLYQQGYDQSFGISVDGNSLGYAISHSIVDARHKALRLLVEWGLIETLGKYEYVPYWKCLPSSNNQQFTKFKDFVGGGDVINFTDLQFQEDPTEAPVVRNDKTLYDKRDRDLMMAVKANFEYAEYVEDKTRQHVRRPIDNNPVTLTNQQTGKQFQVQFPSKRQLVEGLGKLFQKNVAYYHNMNDRAVLDDLYGKFVQNGVLDSSDDIYGSNMYLALWLHAPVRKNARWAY